MWRGLLVLSLISSGAIVVGQRPSDGDRLLARAKEIHKQVPLIDGHNDFPWAVREKAGGDLRALDISRPQPSIMTDIARLRAGGVGGQFWSVYVPVDDPSPVASTRAQIELVHQMTRTYSQVFELALTAADIERIHKAGKIASLIGLEGGHSMGSSLDTLRMFHTLGARYLTLTHSRNTPWADSATDSPALGGLSPFGETVIREMNRLGMLVDLSHVSPETMEDALRVSAAPVIFSHSSARGVTDVPRNVPDAILRMLPRTGGVVMVTFVPGFVSKTHPKPRATLAHVADHIDHIRKVAGVDHVGIGSDFDGIPTGPVGLEDVSTYPALTAELLRRGYSDEEIRKVLGLNVLRVMRAAEMTSAKTRAQT